jgi:hypothetical protein
MTELEKLIWRLEKLQKSRSKSITLDIDYLLGILYTIPSQKVTVTKNEPVRQQVNVDGGGFKE